MQQSGQLQGILTMGNTPDVTPDEMEAIDSSFSQETHAVVMGEARC